MDPERPLKTLHINTERTWRGGEQMTLNLADGLRARGHVAHVLAQPGSPLAQSARRAAHLTFEIGMWADGDVFAMLHIARRLRRERYDVVHLHTPHAHTLGALAALLAGRPLCVVTKRTDFSIYRNSFFGLNRIKYNHFADAIIAVSDHIREVLVGDGVRRERIHRIYSGVDPRRCAAAEAAPLRAEFRLNGAGPVIGHVGHFSEHKGQAHLLHAVPAILERHPGAVFFLVGEGRLRASLVETARQLGIAERVYFPGFRADIAAFLRLFDVFVMPSVMEGLCSSILDAHACALPVVATRTGGIPEIVEHEVHGLLVPPADPEALAAAVCRVLAEPEAARARAAAARGVVESRFSMAQMVESTLEVYRSLLAAVPARRRPERASLAAGI